MYGRVYRIVSVQEIKSHSPDLLLATPATRVSSRARRSPGATDSVERFFASTRLSTCPRKTVRQEPPEFFRRGGLQNRPRISGQIPKNRVKLVPNSVCAVIPGPPQIQRKPEEQVVTFGLRRWRHYHMGNKPHDVGRTKPKLQVASAKEH